MDATTFFLTYPQSEFQHENVHAFLNSIKPVVWARVATELHEDGNPHCHVAVRFGARIKTRSNHRIFDMDGRHPNIQVTRRIKNVLEYVSKGGNFTDFGKVPGEQNTLDAVYELSRGDDREAFDRAALANRLSYQWACHIWNMGHASDALTISAPGEGSECLQLLAMPIPDKTVVVIGPSGCGKTTWAKRVCNKPGLFVTHIDDLKSFDAAKHKSIVFDDMDFQHWPRTAQIHIVDRDDVRSINVKHGKVTLPARLQKIFTANTMPFTTDAAIERRINKIIVESIIL